MISQSVNLYGYAIVLNRLVLSQLDSLKIFKILLNGLSTTTDYQTLQVLKTVGIHLLLVIGLFISFDVSRFHALSIPSHNFYTIHLSLSTMSFTSFTLSRPPHCYFALSIHSSHMASPLSLLSILYHETKRLACIAPWLFGL